VWTLQDKHRTSGFNNPVTNVFWQHRLLVLMSHQLKASTLVKYHAFESVKDTYGSPGKKFWGFN